MLSTRKMFNLDFIRKQNPRQTNFILSSLDLSCSPQNHSQTGSQGSPYIVTTNYNPLETNNNHTLRSQSNLFRSISIYYSIFLIDSIEH